MDANISLHEFLTRAFKPEVHQRKGQRFANHLSLVRPDLLEGLKQRNIDPFYDDTQLWAAVAYVRDNWDIPSEGMKNTETELSVQSSPEKGYN